jgi:hypothetical protein
LLLQLDALVRLAPALALLQLSPQLGQHGSALPLYVGGGGALLDVGNQIDEFAALLHRQGDCQLELELGQQSAVEVLPFLLRADQLPLQGDGTGQGGSPRKGLSLKSGKVDL